MPAIILGLVTLTIYVLTLCPTVAGGDSGELISIVVKLGVAHPPGYPVYTLLAKLFTWIIPISTLAWRINFFSAVCGAATAVVVFKILERWTKNTPVSLATAGLFAFSPLQWRYSLIAEVFGLNTLLLSILIYCGLLYWQTKKDKFLHIGAFVFGLGLAHHHTIVFIGAPTAAFFLWRDRRALLNFKKLGTLFLCLAAGLVPYVYLPWASSKLELVSWGNTSDWDGFVTHFLRTEYGTFKLAWGRSEASFWNGILQFFLHLPKEMLYLGSLVAALGFLHQWKEKTHRTFHKLLIFCFLFYLVVFHLLANLPLDKPLFYDVHTRFWLQSQLVVFIWMGLGLAVIWTRLGKLPQKAQLAVVAVLVGTQVAWNYKHEDQSNNWLIYKHGEASLMPLPENSLLITRGDAFVNVMRYLREVEGKRRDVRVLPLDLYRYPWMKAVGAKHYPDIRIPGTIYSYVKTGKPQEFSFTDFIDANRHFKKIYFASILDEERATAKDRYVYWTHPYFEEVIDRGSQFDFNTYYSVSAETIKLYRPEDFRPARNRSWEEFVLFHFWKNQIQRTEQVFEYASAPGADPSIMVKGIEALETLIARHPKPLNPQLYRNLGVAYQRRIKLDPTAEGKMRAAWEEFLKVAPINDPAIPLIKRNLQASGR